MDDSRQDKPTPLPPLEQQILSKVEKMIEDYLGVSHAQVLAMGRKRKQVLLGSVVLQEDRKRLTWWLCRRQPFGAKPTRVRGLRVKVQEGQPPEFVELWPDGP